MELFGGELIRKQKYGTCYAYAFTRLFVKILKKVGILEDINNDKYKNHKEALNKIENTTILNNEDLEYLQNKIQNYEKIKEKYTSEMLNVDNEFKNKIDEIEKKIKETENTLKSKKENHLIFLNKLQKDTTNVVTAFNTYENRTNTVIQNLKKNKEEILENIEKVKYDKIKEILKTNKDTDNLVEDSEFYYKINKEMLQNNDLSNYPKNIIIVELLKKYVNDKPELKEIYEQNTRYYDNILFFIVKIFSTEGCYFDKVFELFQNIINTYRKTPNESIIKIINDSIVISQYKPGSLQNELNDIPDKDNNEFMFELFKNVSNKLSNIEIKKNINNSNDAIQYLQNNKLYIYLIINSDLLHKLHNINNLDSIPKLDNFNINHGVVITGIEKDNFIIKNSYGIEIGDIGKIKINKNIFDELCKKKLINMMAYEIIPQKITQPIISKKPPKITTTKGGHFPKKKKLKRNQTKKSKYVYNIIIMRNRRQKWSMKYKKSINCRKPKGFSQKQYCKYGRRNQTRKNKK